MSISPSIVVASLPALRIASEAVKRAVEAGVDFASQLGGTSKTAMREGDAVTSITSRSHKLDELLPRLQQFLKSMEISNPHAIELKTSIQGNIEVHGDPEVKQAVEQWLKSNPHWTEAWQESAKEFLRGLPLRFPGANMPQGDEQSTLSLRSRIDASSSDHFF